MVHCPLKRARNHGTLAVTTHVHVLVSGLGGYLLFLRRNPKTRPRVGPPNKVAEPKGANAMLPVADSIALRLVEETAMSLVGVHRVFQG